MSAADRPSSDIPAPGSAHNGPNSDIPSVTDDARADLHPVVTEHQIIGTQTGKQGAGQVVPEDSVLCIKCGWMRCSEYTWHLSDALAAAARAETTTATTEDAVGELLERMSNAATQLESLRDEHWYPPERQRLHGKVEGVKLATSYVEEARGLLATAAHLRGGEHRG